MSKSILLLCDLQEKSAGTVVDHIKAFGKYSKNEIFILSNLGDLPDWLEIDRFDGIIIHYSIVVCYDNFLSPSARLKLRNFKGFKALFIQDDYRWINDTVNALSYLKLTVLFPLTSREIMDKVYDPYLLSGVRKETVLAGYVPDKLLEIDPVPYNQRKNDVVYRARKLPAWMGSHVIQKWEIADSFLKHSQGFSLVCDISCKEEDRIYSDAWIDFIQNSKATIGTESGVSLCDFTGKIQENVEDHLLKYPDDDFETLEYRYFNGKDKKIMMNVISPRIFEAIALRTLLILYPGSYSNALQPWRHYVPLEKDFSNFSEVVATLKNEAKASEIIETAYSEIGCNKDYSFEGLVALFDKVLDQEWKDEMSSLNKPYATQEFLNCGKISAKNKLSIDVGSTKCDLEESNVTLNKGTVADVSIVKTNKGRLFKLWALLPKGLKSRVRPIAKILYTLVTGKEL